ncbi:MAG: HIT family protein [Euryarchaeota archaeon]|nr:HIT family protein [Euryarchaeota archaeon]|tara:strand:- start:316 stop:738 length:423 start_codon:yes stop_codon:yes gene_type:complete
MSEPSLFTKIIRGEIPSSMVAQGITWYAFLDINPLRPGHTLVVPKEEAQRIAELSKESRRDLIDGVVEVQRRLSIEFNTTDFSVNLNDGPLAGQEVPHVHFHVIPRTDDNSSSPMWRMAPSQSKPDFETLASLSKKLQLH